MFITTTVDKCENSLKMIQQKNLMRFETLILNSLFYLFIFNLFIFDKFYLNLQLD